MRQTVASLDRDLGIAGIRQETQARECGAIERWVWNGHFGVTI